MKLTTLINPLIFPRSYTKGKDAYIRRKFKMDSLESKVEMDGSRSKVETNLPGLKFEILGLVDMRSQGGLLLEDLMKIE